MEEIKEDTTRIIRGIEDKILKEIKDYWDGKTTEYLTPHLTDTYRTVLAAWYEKYSEELTGIEQRYPAEWTAIRSGCSSVKEADMVYNQTKDGQRRIELRFKLKSIEKMISALKDRLRRMENEAYNRM